MAMHRKNHPAYVIFLLFMALMGLLGLYLIITGSGKSGTPVRLWLDLARWAAHG